MSSKHHVSDIVWFWTNGDKEPRRALIVELGINVSSLLFEGEVRQISNNRFFSTEEACIQRSMREDFSRWR